MKKLLFLTLLGFTSLSLMAQWSNNDSVNLKINDLKNYSVEVHRHTNGDVYVVNDAPAMGGIKQHLQIISPKGEKRFTDNGLVISEKPTSTYTVVNELSYLDREGNIIIGVEDYRLDPVNKRKSSLSFYKMSPTGEFLWGADGVNVLGGDGMREGRIACTRIVQITDGSYIVMWVVIGMNEGENPLTKIEMQRISADGALLWEKIKTIEDPDNGIMHPYVVDGGNNEAIVIYAKGTNNDIYAKKIDFDGNDVWTKDTRVYKSGFMPVPLQVILNVVPCGEGGALISWYDDRNSTKTESVYCSYLKNDGTLAFSAGEEGQKVGYEGFRSFRPKGLYDKENKCIFVIWEETSAGQAHRGLKVQKLNMEGELLWDAYGVPLVPISDHNVGEYSMQVADQGGVACFYLENMDPQRPYYDVQARMSILNTDGTFRIKERSFAGSKYFKSNMLSTPLYNKQYILLWEDERDGAEQGGAPLYAQNIDLEGRIGEVSNEVILQNRDFAVQAYPNPVGDQLTFTIDNFNKAETASVVMYNSVGQVVSTLFSGNLSVGSHQISWSRPQGLASGVYFAKVQVGNTLANVKLMLK